MLQHDSVATIDRLAATCSEKKPPLRLAARESKPGRQRDGSSRCPSWHMVRREMKQHCREGIKQHQALKEAPWTEAFA
jgi:hypothetical protein